MYILCICHFMHLSYKFYPYADVAIGNNRLISQLAFSVSLIKCRYYNGRPVDLHLYENYYWYKVVFLVVPADAPLWGCQWGSGCPVFFPQPPVSPGEWLSPPADRPPAHWHCSDWSLLDPPAPASPPPPYTESLTHTNMTKDHWTMRILCRMLGLCS